MKFCTNCGQSLDENTTICPKCGTAVAAGVENQGDATTAANNEQTTTDNQTASANQQAQANNQSAQNGAPQGAAYGAQANQQQYQNQGMPQGGYQNPQMGQPMYNAPVDLSDHTSQFTREDIAENKTFALLPYIFGLVGIIVAAIIASDSKFVRFHIREMVKLELISYLVLFISLILTIVIIGPIVGGIISIVLFVVRVIGFVNTCYGKAKELPIISAFKFL